MNGAPSRRTALRGCIDHVTNEEEIRQSGGPSKIHAHAKAQRKQTGTQSPRQTRDGRRPSLLCVFAPLRKRALDRQTGICSTFRMKPSAQFAQLHTKPLGSANFQRHLPFCPRLPIDEERRKRPAVAFPGRVVINDSRAERDQGDGPQLVAYDSDRVILTHTIGIVRHGDGRARMSA